MKHLKHIRIATLIFSSLLMSNVHAGDLSLGGPAVSEGNQWGFGSPKYDYATGKYSSPGIVWNGKGPAPEDGGAGARALFANSIISNAEVTRRADGSYALTGGTYKPIQVPQGQTLTAQAQNSALQKLKSQPAFMEKLIELRKTRKNKNLTRDEFRQKRSELIEANTKSQSLVASTQKATQLKTAATGTLINGIAGGTVATTQIQDNRQLSLGGAPQQPDFANGFMGNISSTISKTTNSFKNMLGFSAPTGVIVQSIATTSQAHATTNTRLPASTSSPYADPKVQEYLKAVAATQSGERTLSLGGR